MNEIEKLLSGVNGGKEIVKLLEGIEELDGVPDKDKEKDEYPADTGAEVKEHGEGGDAGDSEPTAMTAEDADLDDDDVDTLASADNAMELIDSLVDAAADFIIDLKTIDQDPLEKLSDIIASNTEPEATDPAAIGDKDAVASEDAAVGTSADLGSNPTDGMAAAGGEDVDKLKREIAAKDARIKELESQLS